MYLAHESLILNVVYSAPSCLETCTQMTRLNIAHFCHSLQWIDKYLIHMIPVSHSIRSEKCIYSLMKICTR